MAETALGEATRGIWFVPGSSSQRQRRHERPPKLAGTEDRSSRGCLRAAIVPRGSVDAHGSWRGCWALGLLSASSRAVLFHEESRSFALVGCVHSRMTIRVGCDVLDRRMLVAMSAEKVRMLHLHTASIESRQASPRHRCTLTLLFARASAHTTRVRNRRSIHDLRAGPGTRWISRCEPLRRQGTVARSFATGSRRAATLAPSPQLVLQRAGWVVKRGWRWLCTRVLLAEHASGLHDLNLAHGRRAPPEQPGRMGASGTTWAGRIMRFLARSDVPSFAPCGRWHEAVVGQSL